LGECKHVLRGRRGRERGGGGGKNSRRTSGKEIVSPWPNFERGYGVWGLTTEGKGGGEKTSAWVSGESVHMKRSTREVGTFDLGIPIVFSLRAGVTSGRGKKKMRCEKEKIEKGGAWKDIGIKPAGLPYADFKNLSLWVKASLIA